MYLLETSFLIDLAREKRTGDGPASELLNEAIFGAEVSVSTITIAQLAVGEHLTATQSGRRRCQRFREWVEAVCRVRNFTRQHAWTFGRIVAELEKQGQRIPESDAQQAAVAVNEQLTLVTVDRRHFNRIKELLLLTYRRGSE